MSLTRRTFLRTSTFTSAGIAVSGPSFLLASVSDTALHPYLTGIRMAATPASHYRAYRSKPVSSPDTSTWVQIDLKQSVAIDWVHLYPASERGYPGRDGYYAGEGFPLRFRIEAAEDEAFSNPSLIADLTQVDFPDVEDNITRYAVRSIRGRYLRLTATRLRAVKESAEKDSANYTLTLAKIDVISEGRDVAVGCPVTADDIHGNPDFLSQLTRPPREDGENIRMDNPHLVTDPSTWRHVPYKAHAPQSGVTLAGGVFQTAMENNIQYLLNSYTTEELLRQFYERTGKVPPFQATGDQRFWEEDLAGSNAGRFLMGAANTIRWIDHPELRRRINVVVDGIEECRETNGYLMAYPADTIFYSERAAYTRAWLTHGLLEAAYSGNPKALPMLRAYYDWFNAQSFLPLMLRGAVQGGQGMVANTRMATSSFGKPADAQVIQRYYQEEGWLNGLAQREKEQVWQYPYDRPHCYLLTDLEAYLDMYLVTGHKRYYDAVLGAWELYRAHWQQAGGSISIIEFNVNPPDSNYITKQQLGELCGSSFWVFLSQRFQLLDPDNERYAAEIEKSIYNVALANQDGGEGLRYHTLLEGKKEKSTHHNTCCEGQGTRLLGSLPEHIYSIAPDGLYLHLYEPSTIHWEQQGNPLSLTVATSFPFDTHVRATVNVQAATEANLRIRIPSWAGSEMLVKVNGKTAGKGKPGTYLPIHRKWSDNDAIEFSLPASIRVTRYKGEEQIDGKTRYSIEYGPILLAAVGASRIDLVLDKGKSAEALADQLVPDADKPLHFTLRGNPGQRIMPYWQISAEEFTCFPTITTTT